VPNIKGGVHLYSMEMVLANRYRFTGHTGKTVFMP